MSGDQASVAHPRRLSRLLATSTADHPVKIMALGDSITLGASVPPPAMTLGYREDLYRNLSAKGTVVFVGSQSSGVGPASAHDGFSGYRTDQLLSIATRDMPVYRPDIVLLMAGTNDFRQSYPLRMTLASLTMLIDAIHHADPEAVIIVGSIPNGHPSIPSVGGYNDALPEVARAEARAGVRCLFADAGGSLNPGTDLADGTHPNSRGYKRLAEAWAKAIERD